MARLPAEIITDMERSISMLERLPPETSAAHLRQWMKELRGILDEDDARLGAARPALVAECERLRRELETANRQRDTWQERVNSLSAELEELRGDDAEDDMHDDEEHEPEPDRD